MLGKMGKIVSKSSSILRKFIQADMLSHMIMAFVVRFILVIYGVVHDNYFEVPYTDVDYRVFTDAARHVTNGDSPYERPTYRYSPLLAIIMTPNIYLHETFGKLFFCGTDLIVAFFIRRLVHLNVFDWMSKYESHKSQKAPLLVAIEPKAQKRVEKKRSKAMMPSKCNVKLETAAYFGHRAMLFWLYNPMTVAISTRGNSDSLACLLVVLVLYFIQTDCHPFLVGLIYGLAVHFRLYPIVYCFLFYMYYSEYSYYFDRERAKTGKQKRNKVAKKVEAEKTLIKARFWSYLLPNFRQVMLVAGTVSALTSVTALFYCLYGYQFLYESLIYHFIRVDFKHNFSPYFYLQYLTAFVKIPAGYTGDFWQPILVNLPPLILLWACSIEYGLNKFSLNFGVLVETIVFVIYNKVITSQYFVWIMGVLPLCLWQIKLSKTSVACMLAIWFLAQAAWLFPAYLLEFKGEDTFLYIWIQGVSLFCAHIGILGRLIKNFILPMGVLKSVD